MRSGTSGGYRLVLGVVSVPPAYGPQVVPTQRQPWAKGWPYWRKAGLVVKGGAAPVTVSVPSAWRPRAAITWGNTGPVSALRIASCPVPVFEPRRPWNAYAGGFFIRARAACVPLEFRVARRSAIVRFGLGKRCS